MSTITAPPPPIPVTAPSPTPSYTPEDLLTISDGRRYELVDGRLEELSVSFDSSELAMTIGSLIRAACHPGGLGRVLGADCGYQCFPSHPARVRKPDVSFIKTDRLPTPERRAAGHVRIAPDLAVEVVSPNDLAEDLEKKLDDYRDAGVPLVWVVFPSVRRVRVLRLGKIAEDFGSDAELIGEDILPGFRVPVSDLFAGLPGDPRAAS